MTQLSIYAWVIISPGLPRALSLLLISAWLWAAPITAETQDETTQGPCLHIDWRGTVIVIMVMVTVTDRLIVMDVRCRFLFTLCTLLLTAGSDGSPFTDCIQSKGKAGFYEGFIDATESGAKCMNWNDVPGVIERYPGKGLGDHSFCRNPDGRIRPWCFFPNSRGRIDWGYCDCKQGSYI